MFLQRFESVFKANCLALFNQFIALSLNLQLIFPLFQLAVFNLLQLSKEMQTNTNLQKIILHLWSLGSAFFFFLIKLLHLQTIESIVIIYYPLTFPDKY